MFKTIRVTPIARVTGAAPAGGGRGSKYRFWRGVLISAFCLVLPAVVNAQEAASSLTGVVKSRKNQVIPQAHVTVRHVGTNQVKTADTDEKGMFTVVGLPGGDVEVVVESSGYATLVVSGLRLSEIVTTEVDFILDVETRPGEKIVATDPATSTSVRMPLVLPLFGRRFTELALLTPGVTRPSVQENRFSVNGSRDRTFILDGVDGLVNTDASGVNTRLLSIGAEAISEFQVARPFTAEEDYAGLNEFDAVVKSGSNSLHGSISFNFRHDALQAKGPFGGDSEPSFDRELIAGTLGGPIKKNRAYYFVTLEHLRDDAATTAGRRDPAARRIVQTFAATPLNETRLTTKINGNIAGDSVGAGYSLARRRGTTPGTPEGGRLQDPNNFQTESFDSHLVTAGWFHIFNPVTVNDLKIRFTAARDETDPVSSAPQIAFPSINVGANFRAGLNERWRTLQLTEKVDWAYGRQTFKFGGEFKRTSLDTRRLDLFGAGVVFVPCDFPGERGCPTAASDVEIPVLLALVNRRRLGVDGAGSTAGEPVPTISNNKNALFLQDDIRFRDLSLNLGLRWQYDTDINGRRQVNRARPGKRESKKTNLGPRFGAAWRLGRGVIRGGHGLYFTEVGLETRQLELVADGARQPLVRSFGGTLGDPFGHVLPGGPPDIFVTGNDFRAPFLQQFSLQGDYEVTNDLLVSAAYQGRRGSHFGRKVEVNLLPDGGRVNAAFGSVRETQSVGETSYDALVLNVSRRYRRGYAFMGLYSLSRARDEENASASLLSAVSDPSDPALDRGPSPYDARHRLGASGLVDLPWRLTLSGNVVAASSYPFEINQNHDFSEGRRANFYRLPVLGRNAGARGIRTGADVNRAVDIFNANEALVRAHSGPLGHVEPGIDLTHPYFSLDLALQKTFEFSEKARLRVGVEVFNVTNHTNIYGTSPMNISGLQNNVESPNFGKPLGVLPGGVFGAGAPRAAQLTARFSF
jgi:hypothetical protein